MEICGAYITATVHIFMYFLGFTSTDTPEKNLLDSVKLEARASGKEKKNVL